MAGPGVGDQSMPPCVAALVARFREIGEAEMKTLPLYNPKLEVEAVGFRPWADGWIGVLVTPWCMNVVVLDETPQPLDYNAIGRAASEALPSGTHKFKVGGDRETGLYRQLSLHSPMAGFAFQEAARVEAMERLAELMAPPAEEEVAMPAPAPALDRRSFLRGRHSA